MATSDPLHYLFELGGNRYRVTSLAGEESLSRPYRFELDLRVEPDDPIDPDEVVGSDATLVLQRSSDLRRVQGVATQVVRAATRTGEAGGGRVRVVLEPRCALARHRRDIRVFRDKTVPEIVAEVIGAHGIDVELRLAGSYKQRPYCVQMRESDLDFASRLLEDEGIFYRSTDDGRFVMGDATSAYDDGPGAIPFRHASALEAQHDAVFEVGWEGRATAGKVSLRDFNPEHPSLDLDVSATGPTPWGPEWYDYPGEYELADEGRAMAALRAEALACQKWRLAGRSSCARFRPGDRFTLTGAPAGVDDGEHVVTRVIHGWDRTAEGFSIEFEALGADRVFRPPVTTPVPTLPNPLSGFVTGPAGADIHTDDWGRVKVHFPWDRLQPKDERCSHWIPVLQDNTGRSSAMPRIGWEVLCHFLEGDPDRPVVLGRLFNAADPFMERLPDQKTRTSLMSLSSPRAQSGPTGYNMIRFEDLAGHEAIEVHAQKDQNLVIANDQKEQVDTTETRQVRGNETIVIGTEQRTVVTKDYVPVVDGNQSVSIGSSRSAQVKGMQSESVGGNHTLTIGGAHKRIIATADNVTVEQNLKETVGGVVLEGSVAANTTTAGRVSVLGVGGGIVEIARTGKTEGSGRSRVEAVGGIAFAKAGKTMATRADKSRSTTVGGAYLVNALKELLLSGLVKLKTRSLTAAFKSPAITLKVGETEVHLKDGRIHLKASKQIAFETEQENKQATDTSTQV